MIRMLSEQSIQINLCLYFLDKMTKEEGTEKSGYNQLNLFKWMDARVWIKRGGKESNIS